MTAKRADFAWILTLERAESESYPHPYIWRPAQTTRPMISKSDGG